MRTFQLDIGISEFIASLQPGQLQVGLLLGRIGAGKRDVVCLLLRTPQEEGTRTLYIAEDKPKAAKKGAQRNGLELRMYLPDVVNHALRVSPLLPGGIEIVGLYLIAPDAASTSALPQLSRGADCFFEEKGDSDVPTLLLQIDPASKKIVSKEHVSNSKQASALKPCETRFQDVLGNLTTVTCRHFLDLEISLPTDDKSLSNHISAAVVAECTRMQGATPGICGRLLAQDSSVTDLMTSGAAEELDMQLLCSPSCRHVPQEEQATETSGRLRIQGMIVGRAHCHKREAAAAAAALLKADAARSLQARADVLILEAEQVAESSPLMQPAADKQHTLKFPRRAFFPVQGALHFNDLVLPGEGAEQVQSTAEALLIELVPSSIQWPEDEALEKLEPRSRLKNSEVATVDFGLGEGRPPIPFGFRSGQQVLVISTIICIVSCFVSWLILSGIVSSR